LPRGSNNSSTYSAGCQSVRRELVAGADPAAIVTIDGTHANPEVPEAES
jgi:hypothetical protein